MPDRQGKPPEDAARQPIGIEACAHAEHGPAGIDQRDEAFGAAFANAAWTRRFNSSKSGALIGS